MLTKFQVINRLSYGDAIHKRNPEVAFAANMILTQQRKPITRLRGLLAIIEAGDNDVTVSRDGMLYVNGNSLAWPRLELPLQQIAEIIPLRFKAEGGGPSPP